MVGGSPMQAVLMAPGVKDRKVMAFRRDALKDKDAVAALIRDMVAAAGGPRSAFHVLDLARVVDLHRGWRRSLPAVRPFYAVKCNPDGAMLAALAALGAGFDCASRAEIEAVLRLRVIGEPGRYFAETAFTLAARVIGKRVRGELREYWIDDGLYGSLNCILMDHYVPRPRPLAGARHGEETHASTVFGPTCDSLDTVVTGYQLPEMSVGDWLVFDDMGAYTTAAGSNFNGFATSDIKIYLAYSS
uniref:ornithine decarboxylase n=1 Tax=Oryza brachyantha TaxID=4533 RepID=J3MZP9_ORYBR